MGNNTATTILCLMNSEFKAILRCILLSSMFLVLSVGNYSLHGEVSGTANPDEVAPDKALKLAGLYFKLSKFSECRAALTSVLRREPNNCDGLTMMGKLELREGHAEAAEKHASHSLEECPDDVEATILKAYAVKAQGRKDEANILFARVNSDDLKSRKDDYENLGSIASEGGAPPITLDDADIRDKELDEIRAALAKKELDKAEKLSVEAFKKAPKDYSTVTVRAEVLAETGKPAEAAAMLKKLKASQPASAGVFAADIDLADALHDSGSVDEARKLYQSIASDSRYPDSDRKDAKKALENQKVDDLLAEADKAMDSGKVTEASRLCEEALKLAPDSNDVKALHARVLNATGHSSEALRKLEALKQAVPAGSRFEEQLNYASALQGTHQYQEAAKAYAEVINGGDKYPKEEVKDAVDRLQDLQENHLAGGKAEVLTGKFEEGRLWRASTEQSSTRVGNTRYLARFTWDNVKLDDKIYPKPLSEDRFSGTVGVDQMLNSEWNGTLFAGAHESNAMVNGGLDYHTKDGLRLGLNLAYHDPARDTLLLTAMDGRQNAATATAEIPMGKHFALDSTFVARQIEVDGTKIGDALGLESQFRWHPFTLERDIYVAYALELKDFSASNNAFDRESKYFFGAGESFLPSATDAVPDHINRHAFQMHGSTPLSSQLTAAATAEVAWRQETEQTEFGAVAELIWKLSTRASLNARFEYYSGGAGPNAGEDVIIGALGTRWTW